MFLENQNNHECVLSLSGDMLTQLSNFRFHFNRKWPNQTHKASPVQQQHRPHHHYHLASGCLPKTNQSSSCIRLLVWCMLNKLVRPSKGVIKFELALDREKVPHPHSAVADIMRLKSGKKNNPKKPGQGRRRMTSDYYYKHTLTFSSKFPRRHSDRRY